MTGACVTSLLPVKEHHPPYLRAAVDSLCRQTNPHWAALVIVEPEDHDSFSGLLRHDLRDPRIELLVNRGRRLAGAFNTGMRAARSDFVAILLADDMWAPNAVAVLDEQMRAHPEIDFFHSARTLVDEDGRPISSVHASPEEFELEDFLRGSPVKHLLCWRRETALAFGGMDETLRSVGPDDFDFPWTMAERGAAFRTIPEPLYIYRDHRECYRLTTHLPRSVHVRELRRILRKHGVGRVRAERFVRAARRSYLRQCLYSTPVDRWLKQRLGRDARHGWRETYL